MRDKVIRIKYGDRYYEFISTNGPEIDITHFYRAMIDFHGDFSKQSRRISELELLLHEISCRHPALSHEISDKLKELDES